jgi:hypothetical protein
VNLALALALFIAQTQEYRLTTGSGIRARAEPKASAAEVVRLPIGSVLLVKERSPKPETIDGKTEHWYRVELPKNASGWIFGGFTHAVDPARAAEAHLELWRERSKVETTQFAERADLAELLLRSAYATKSKELAAELELAHWLATKWTLKAIDYEKMRVQPYQGWLEKQGQNLAYSEPAGEWLMNANFGWAIEERHRGTAIADDMAWEAASTPYPGECEGYVPCYLSLMNAGEGRYLERYPNGKHVAEALKAAVETLNVQQELLTGIAEEDKKSMRIELETIRKTLLKIDPKLASPALKEVARLSAVAK